MVIIQRYILREFIRIFLLTTFISIALFFTVDFFDRIDNILSATSDVPIIMSYFAYKIPHHVLLVIPLCTLISVLFLFGGLAIRAELTAMRASGATIWFLSKPVVVAGFVISIVSFALSEFVVPYTSQRASEIYNIDIKRKDDTGTYSQDYFWWRDGNKFYSADFFDSRTNTLTNVSEIYISSLFKILYRIDAKKAIWLGEDFGWQMEDVVKYIFTDDGSVLSKNFIKLPLPVLKRPRDFFDVKLKPESMTYSGLKKFMENLQIQGGKAEAYKAELYAKLSFPLVSIICVLIAVPFGAKVGRNVNFSASFLLALALAFMYYVVHSVSIALGKAELMPPLLSAWMANILFCIIAFVLNIGAERPMR